MMFFSWFIVNIAAVHEQINASAAGIDSTVGESSPPEPVLLKNKTEENFEPLGINLQQVPIEGESQQTLLPSFIHTQFHIEEGVEAAPNVEEHQFIPSCPGKSPVHQNNKQENPELKNLWALRNTSEEEMSVSLQLGKPEPKRRKQAD